MDDPHVDMLQKSPPRFEVFEPNSEAHANQVSKPHASYVESENELLSDFLDKKSGKKGKGGSSSKTWKWTDRIVNKKAGGSLDKVCYSSKRSHMDIDCYELPTKRRQVFHDSKEEARVVEASS